jgi:transcription initiation factor TFIID subunit TAF12
MRQFHRRALQQQQEQQQAVQPQMGAVRAPNRVAPPSEVPGAALDHAAALWTTRRIRSYLRLVDASSEPSQR